MVMRNALIPCGSGWLGEMESYFHSEAVPTNQLCMASDYLVTGETHFGMMKKLLSLGRTLREQVTYQAAGRRALRKTAHSGGESKSQNLGQRHEETLDAVAP